VDKLWPHVGWPEKQGHCIWLSSSSEYFNQFAVIRMLRQHLVVVVVVIAAAAVGSLVSAETSVESLLTDNAP